jgi:hypothetical protein
VDGLHEPRRPSPPRVATPVVRIEYLGFSDNGAFREYRLRVIEGTNPTRDFVLLIAHEAFAAQHARYQDGPDICYQKMLKAFEASPEQAERLTLSVEDLKDYRMAHSPKPSRRRAPPPASSPAVEPAPTKAGRP